MFCSGEAATFSPRLDSLDAITGLISEEIVEPISNVDKGSPKVVENDNTNDGNDQEDVEAKIAYKFVVDDQSFTTALKEGFTVDRNMVPLKQKQIKLFN